jgi:hypothetical protein
MRRLSFLALVWLLSMFAVGTWASGQAPPQAVPLPPAGAPPARGVPPAQDDPARIISGNDIGFRVEDVKSNRLVGRFVVRVNGQWREVEESAITKRLTQR